MRLGLPSSDREIRPDAHEVAQRAVPQAGLPVEDWPNTMIMQKGIAATRQQAPARTGNLHGGDFPDLQARLEQLAWRIEQIARAAPTTFAPEPEYPGTDHLSQSIRRLEQRLQEVAARLPDRWTTLARAVPDFDRAAAEFSEPRRALDDEDVLAQASAAFAPDPPNQSTQDIAAVLDCDAMLAPDTARPGTRSIEDEIGMLRNELGDIAYTLKEALPRHLVEAIESRLANVVQQMVQTGHSGSDRGPLGAVEKSITEIHETVRKLMPAEKLAGYNEAITALSQKIDLILAERDPATMHQLERSIAALREISSRVATNDTVGQISNRIQMLADRIDHLAIGSGSNDILANLQDRIEALTKTLSERSSLETAVPQRLEAVAQSLADSIGLLQNFRPDEAIAQHLEDRIGKLIERLDASGARLDQLQSIERGLTDLLAHMEGLSSSGDTASIRAEAATIESVKQEVSLSRTALESLHTRLGDLSDRLASIEREFRGDWWRFAGRGNEFRSRTGREQTDQAPPASQGLRISIPTSYGMRGGDDPRSSDDHPLEPGSGRPGGAGALAGGSNASLESARSKPTSAGKADFIAAARRAAQAAGHDGRDRKPRSESWHPDAENVTPPSRMMRRVKGLVIAASAAVIGVGVIHYGEGMFDFGVFESRNGGAANEQVELGAPEKDPESVVAVPSAQPSVAVTPETDPKDVSESVDTALLAPPMLPNLTPAPPLASVPMSGDVSLQGKSNSSRNTPSILSAPAMNTPGVVAPPPGEVTGSVTALSRKNAKPDAQPPQTPAERLPTTQAPSERLPATIGSQRLRSAALSGDPAAAYEIAMRFVEGRGVPLNLEEAARWFERAASKGITPAQFRYASMLEKGQGVKKDLAAAQRLYIAAANKGHAKAMHNLAVLYAEGAEGRPDYATAAEWFRKAAQHGVADSQYNLGVLAARGLGTEKNLIEAYKWFALAAAQGDREAIRKRDDVAGRLDAQALATAQQAVNSFTPAAQPPEAITVSPPAGGWDGPPQPTHQRQKAAGPLSLSAFNSGRL